MNSTDPVDLESERLLERTILLKLESEDNAKSILHVDEDSVWIGLRGGNIQIMSCEDGIVRKVIKAHTKFISYMLLVGNKVWTASGDDSIAVISLEGEILHKLNGHSSTVTVLATNRSYVWSGSADCTIRQWDVNTMQCVHVFKGHRAPINSIQWAAGKLWSASNDGMRVWPRQEEGSHSTFRKLLKSKQVQVSILCSVSDHIWCACSDNVVRIFNSATEKLVHSKIVPPRGINSIVLLGWEVWMAYNDKFIQCYDHSSFELIREFVAHSCPVTNLSVACCTQVWSIGATDRALKVWSVTMDALSQLQREVMSLFKQVSRNEKAKKKLSSSLTLPSSPPRSPSRSPSLQSISSVASSTSLSSPNIAADLSPQEQLDRLKERISDSIPRVVMYQEKQSLEVIRNLRVVFERDLQVLREKVSKGEEENRRLSEENSVLMDQLSMQQRQYTTDLLSLNTDLKQENTLRQSAHLSATTLQKQIEALRERCESEEKLRGIVEERNHRLELELSRSRHETGVVRKQLEKQLQKAGVTLTFLSETNDKLVREVESLKARLKDEVVALDESRRTVAFLEKERDRIMRDANKLQSAAFVSQQISSQANFEAQDQIRKEKLDLELAREDHSREVIRRVALENEVKVMKKQMRNLGIDVESLKPVEGAGLKDASVPETSQPDKDHAKVVKLEIRVRELETLLSRARPSSPPLNVYSPPRPPSPSMKRMRSPSPALH